MPKVSRTDAALQLGLTGDEVEMFKTWASSGGEIPTYSGKLQRVELSECQQWKVNRDFRTVTVTRDDYLRCLNFTLQMYYSSDNIPLTNNFTSTQRDIGQVITNHIIGKLGEIGLQRLLASQFGTDITIDFDVRPRNVVGQDITEVTRPTAGGRRVSNPPRIRVAVKTTKMKNVWLVVRDQEVTDQLRTSDYYVMARVDLPHDHLVRFMRNLPDLSAAEAQIPYFEDIPVELVGFIAKDALQGPTTVIRTNGRDTQIQPSRVAKSGALQATPAQWEAFAQML